MFRIIKYEKGYVVEIQKTKWWGKKYWTHFISVSGIASQPWYFSTFDIAMDELLNEVKFQALRNVRRFLNS